MNSETILMRSSLSQDYPFFAGYTFNEYGAPMLNGGSPVDLGIALLYVQELNKDSNSTNMSELLSVSKLTCKNWIKKLCLEAACDIQWNRNQMYDNYNVVNSTGIFSSSFYEIFRPYVKATIDEWRLKNGKEK